MTRRDEVLENQQSLVRALRGSLPYLEEFHHQVFVVCVNGELLQRDAAPKIMEELALLHRVGIQLVLVHQIHFSFVANNLFEFLYFSLDKDIFLKLFQYFHLKEYMVC